MSEFDQVFGQDHIKEFFKNAVLTGNVPHACILSGEAGMGKRRLAELFARNLLCERGGPEACGQCHSCIQTAAGTHPDLIFVTHEKPASIGVDDVREQIQDSIVIRPYSGRYKIYIVDEAEKMTVQAQNALLKTIEALFLSFKINLSKRSKSTCISFSLTLISTRLKTVLCTKYSFGFSFFENRFVHSIVSTKDNSNSKKFAFVILTGDVLVRFSSLASIYFSSFSLVFDLNIL